MSNPVTEVKVLDGIDLILSIDGDALGFSTGCKITTTTETGERLTKESAGGKWKEKYVKSFSEEITADGCQLRTADTDRPTYDELKAKQLAAEPIDVSYGVRTDGGREGSTTNCYGGKYIITSLELDGQAGDDAKYSIKLENCGAVAKTGTGIAAAAGA